VKGEGFHGKVQVDIASCHVEEKAESGSRHGRGGEKNPANAGVLIFTVSTARASSLMGSRTAELSLASRG